MFKPGLAEMHLAVDHTWQNMQMAGIDLTRGAGGPKLADGGNSASADRDIAHAEAVVVHHRAAAQDQIVGHQGLDVSGIMVWLPL